MIDILYTLLIISSTFVLPIFMLWKWSKENVTNVNGDKRIMTCTLKEDAIPGYKPANKDKKVNKEVVSVWDINAEGWRSFRLANITEVATV